MSSEHPKLRHPVGLNGDPADVAVALRDQYGPYRAWLYASHQADQESAKGDHNAAGFWRRVVNAIDGLEK